MALTTLDRTNRDNAFYQVKAATRAAFAKNEAVLSTFPDATYKAIVLFSEDKITLHQNSWGNGLETTPHEMGGSWAIATERYKIYFRIPLLHAHLPLPPSFRNIHIPAESDFQVTGHLAQLAPQFDTNTLDPNIVFSQTYTGDYCLEPEAEEALLIACHPSLWVSLDSSNLSSGPSHLDPGDVIEVKFSDGTFKSAKLVKVIAKGLNIVKSWSGDTASALDKFDGDTSTVSDYEPTDDFTNIINKLEHDLKKVEGTIKTPGIPAAAGIVESELKKWDWGKNDEDDPAMSVYLDKYWANVGVTTWSNATDAWSAAWISYVLSDYDFPGKRMHYLYTQRVINEGGPLWHAYSIPKNKGKIKIAIGDVVVKPRSDPEKKEDDYFWAHADIVYEIDALGQYGRNGLTARTAGGNVGGSVKQTNALTLDSDHTLLNSGEYLIVLKYGI